MFKNLIVALLLLIPQQIEDWNRVRRLEAIHDINVCGNGVLEPDFQESCDAFDLGGQSCALQGFDGGTLVCSPSCELDLSGCVNDPPPQGQLWPRMSTPPGGSLAAFDGWVDEQCGLPRSQWPVYEVGPGKQYATAAELRNIIPTEGLAVIRLYAQPAMYATLNVKGKKCVEVVGVGTPMPQIQGINMAGGYSAGQIVKPGGLIVRGVGVFESANCVGVPADRQFLSIEDSEIGRCYSHAFLTDDDAHHLYVRMLRTHLHDGGSMHLAYIDRVARADVIDNLCENPGGGHCIRVVAYSGLVKGNKVSSVSLDGTLKEKWDKPGSGAMSIGMHPLETYNCSDMVVEDNEAMYYLSLQSTPGAYKLRGRGDINSCDVEGKTTDGKFWIGLSPEEDRYQDPELWARIGADLDLRGNQSRYAMNTVYQRNVTKTLGPGSLAKDRGVSVQANSSWPQHDPLERETFVVTLKAHIAANLDLLPPASGLSWEQACQGLASRTEDRNLKWVLLQVRPKSMSSICGKGNLTEWVAMPAPSNWRERNYFTWGLGNQTLVCTDLAHCAAYTPNVQLDDKQRTWFHPGDPTTKLLNVGGAVVILGDEQ